METFLIESLVDIYTSWKGFEDAEAVVKALPIPDVESSIALMAAYSESGFSNRVLDCKKQLDSDGLFLLNPTVFVYSLKACGDLRDLDHGRGLHLEVEKYGFGESTVASALITMYSKCGSLTEAQKVFDEMNVRDTVAWTIMLVAYAEHGFMHEALGTLCDMQADNARLDSVACVCGLKACGAIGALDMGQEIHSEIERKNLLGTDVVRNTLVDMYAKCGSLAEAQQLLKNLPAHDIIAWNSLIAGYAQLGEVDNVVHMFDLLLCKGLKPDSITFVILLTACSHLGLVNKSELYYEWMIKGFGLAPRFEHHSCMIDVLGRTGQLEKATTLMRRLQCSPDLVICRTILGACKKWGHLELGKKVFERAVQLDE